MRIKQFHVRIWKRNKRLSLKTRILESCKKSNVLLFRAHERLWTVFSFDNNSRYSIHAGLGAIISEIGAYKTFCTCIVEKKKRKENLFWFTTIANSALVVICRFGDSRLRARWIRRFDYYWTRARRRRSHKRFIRKKKTKKTSFERPPAERRSVLSRLPFLPDPNACF